MRSEGLSPQVFFFLALLFYPLLWILLGLELLGVWISSTRSSFLVIVLKGMRERCATSAGGSTPTPIPAPSSGGPTGSTAGPPSPRPEAVAAVVTGRRPRMRSSLTKTATRTLVLVSWFIFPVRLFIMNELVALRTEFLMLAVELVVEDLKLAIEEGKEVKGCIGSEGEVGNLGKDAILETNNAGMGIIMSVFFLMQRNEFSEGSFSSYDLLNNFLMGDLL